MLLMVVRRARLARVVNLVHFAQVFKRYALCKYVNRHHTAHLHANARFSRLGLKVTPSDLRTALLFCKICTLCLCPLRFHHAHHAVASARAVASTRPSTISRTSSTSSTHPTTRWTTNKTHLRHTVVRTVLAVGPSRVCSHFCGTVSHHNKVNPACLNRSRLHRAFQ